VSLDLASPGSPFRAGPALLAAGAPRGPLAGWRLAVKDLYAVAGQRIGAGNPDFLADAALQAAHAEAVRRLLAAGASVTGLAHSDELAFSLEGSNAHYGVPTNVRAPGRLPGGSSSGSAAAVAAGLADIALGTDTGGSVRVPASYCGVFGFRATHGRIPAQGLVALAPSYDTVGLFAATGADLAAAGRPLVGLEARSVPPPVDRYRELTLAADLLALLDADCRRPFLAAAAELADLLDVPLASAHLTGAPLVEDIPDAADPAVVGGSGVDLSRPGPGPGAERLARWVDAYRQRSLWEAWQVHGEWVARRHPSFGPGVGARFEQARSTTEPEPLAPIRAEIVTAVAHAAGPGGVLLVPAAAGPAPPIGHPGAAARRPRTLGLGCVASVGGLPAVSLPLVRVDGLPLGLSLVGAPGEDERLLALAARVGAPRAG
jgi:amidase